jgi:Fibronectin type III domain
MKKGRSFSGHFGRHNCHKTRISLKNRVGNDFAKPDANRRNESRNMFFGKESRNSRAAQGRIWGAVLLSVVLFCNCALSAQIVSLAWNSSSNSSVAGYFLYCGSQAGVYTNRIDIGNNTAASVSGLLEGQTYHFAVSAYSSTGTESPLSSDLPYITPGAITMLLPTNSSSMNLEFPVAPNHWYEVQASPDLHTWTTIGQTGVATSNAWTEFTDPQAGQYSTRFYRLILN